MDVNSLHENILESLHLDPAAAAGLDLANDSTQTHWTIGEDDLLRLDDRIYVPDQGDLHLQVLRNHHDHPLAGHFGMNRMLDSIRRTYTWPRIHEFVRSYVSSCTTCGCNKPRRHRPYAPVAVIIL